MCVPWPLLRQAHIGSFATLCWAARECRCWHGQLILESRAHGPCSSNGRQCQSLQRRLCSDCWRPFGPNPRGTTRSRALDSRLRRTAGSPWRRNVFPQRAAGAETAGRLRKFNFNPPSRSAFARNELVGWEGEKMLLPYCRASISAYFESAFPRRGSIFYIVTAITPLTRL